MWICEQALESGILVLAALSRAGSDVVDVRHHNCRVGAMLRINRRNSMIAQRVNVTGNMAIAFKVGVV